MDVAAFDFRLPEERIALRPAQPRDAARLLVVEPGGPGGARLIDDTVAGLTRWLRAGDILVLNDTRVIPSRLAAVRRRGEAAARVELMLHKRLSADRWAAFARPAKKLAEGDRVAIGHDAAGAACAAVRLDATVEARGEGGEATLRFDLSGPHLDEAIARLGELPLPPYIAGRRPADAADLTDYQTVFAREDGAVAAPTAGLHFTDDLFDRLAAHGIGRAFVTLHVGAGTFLPVKADDTADHRMHAEWGSIPADTAARLNAARAAGGRIVAVGTTSLRLLESAVDGEGRIRPFSGDTAIFITPGRRIRAADLLITNFHLPRSTLFMLVCAFSGLNAMHKAYAHAIDAGYRFYSYGDASLLFPARDAAAAPTRG